MIDKLKPFLKEDANTEEVSAVINELQQVNPDKLETAYLNNDVAVRSWADRKVGKALETFKTQTMNSLVEEQVRARLEKHKNESEAEKQLRLINERLDKAENERKREQHINKALEYASGKIPAKYVHKLLGSDADETIHNIDEFIKDFNISVNEQVDERFKEHGRSVNYKANSAPERTTFTDEEVAKMSSEEFKKNFHKIVKQK
jgi:hypothetical protein